MNRVYLYVLTATAILTQQAAGQGVRDHVDYLWFRDRLLNSHANLYRDAMTSSTGFLYTRLQRDWSLDDGAEDNWNTTVGDPRGLFTLGVGGRLSLTERSQYVGEVNKAVDFLRDEVADPVYGGFVHGFFPDGSWYTGDWPYDNLTGKDALGHGHIMFASTTAYKLTRDPNHLATAYQAWGELDAHLRDPGHTGGFLGGASRDWSTTWPKNQRHINHMLHIFEPVMELYEITRDPALLTAGEQIGDFIATTMYQPLAADPTKGYWANNYAADWSPDPDNFIDVGHNIEMTFLLSRAVELGFAADDPAAWLAPAENVINLLMDVAYDDQGDEVGGFLDHRISYDGSLQSNEWSKSSWQTMELARALMHWAEVRGRGDLWDEFDETLALYESAFLDDLYGSDGPYGAGEMGPGETYSRGAHWGGGYHTTMFYLEALRLSVLEGDANGDGAVTDADYTIWADNFGLVGADWLSGDFNGDGAVTDADYTLWADHFGTSVPGYAPEPASLAMLAIGAAAALRRRASRAG